MGFVKQMLTAGTFGATLETDLINLSEGFIGDTQYILVQVLLTSFVAVYLHIKENDEHKAKQLAVNVGKAFSVIAGSVVVMIILFASSISSFLAPTYTAENSSQLAFYLRLFAPTLFFFVWSAIFHALLNANQRFIPGQLEGISQSIILILLILLFKSILGVNVLVIAFLAYTIWNALFLGTLSRSYWTLSSDNPFKNAEVKQLLKMSGPLFLGYSMVFINQQVGKILVSGLSEGTITAMGYAGVLSNLISTLIGSFASILFPHITNHIVKKEDRSAAQLVSVSSILMMAVFLPITIITILCAEDIVSIVFGRGAFNAENVRISAAALRGYAVMFVPLILRELFSRFQYGYQNSKVPMINSTVGIIVNIVLSIALCPYFGVFGVALASSISVCICGLLNMITAKRNNSFLRITPFAASLPWLCIGGTACYIAAQWSVDTFPISSSVLRFGTATLCGCIAYVAFTFIPLRRIITGKKASG